MRNEESIGHIVRSKAAITRLTLTYKISLVDIFLFFPLTEIEYFWVNVDNSETQSTLKPILLSSQRIRLQIFYTLVLTKYKLHSFYCYQVNLIEDQFS